MIRKRRHTYRHGNVRAAALATARRLVAVHGHVALSLRQVAAELGIAHRSLYNHFADREALLDAVAAAAFHELADLLRPVRTPAAYVRRYVRYALANPTLYALMTSRPHATMKATPDLQAAAHAVITEAMRIFARPGQPAAARRRVVMKTFILAHGGITLHLAGILDVGGDAGLMRQLTGMLAEAGA